MRVCGAARGAAVVRHALAAATLLAGAWLVVRREEPARFDLVSTGPVADLAFAVAALALAGLLVVPRLGRLLRAVAALLALLLIAMAGTRWRTLVAARDSDYAALVGLAIEGHRNVDHLPPRERAEWGLRIMLHLQGDDDRIAPMQVPAEWPLPADVELARWRREDGALVAASRTTDRAVTCLAVVTVAPGRFPARERVPECTTGEVAGGADFAMPLRSTESLIPVEGAAVRPTWPQHRADAERSARPEDIPVALRKDTAATGWQTEVHTPIRAGLGLAGDLVLVGGHGTGSMAAIDARTGRVRWRARAPDWIHMAPVSDGRIVVVGFGDNHRGFRGMTPSGVAAYALADGHRLWTRFEESTVMTSVILHHGEVVYATAAGIVRARDANTGRLLRQGRLPGFVIMGPPVARNDTLVATLDPDRVCAVHLGSMAVLWCRVLPGYRMVGHSAAALSGDLVLLSGVSTVVTGGWRGLLEVGFRPALGQLRSLLFPKFEDPAYAGHAVVALDLATGAIRWRSPHFARRRYVNGHTAGTPSVDGDLAVVVLPFSDTLVALNAASGAIRWAEAGLGARGPVLVTDDVVVVAGREGRVDARELATGQLRCRLQRGEGWDRAGPIRVGERLVFADLGGTVEAIPADSLLACVTVRVASRVPPRLSRRPGPH